MYTKSLRIQKSIFGKITIITIFLILLCCGFSSFFLLSRFWSEMQRKDRLLVSEAAGRIADFTLDKYNMVYNQRTLMHSTDHIANVISSTRSKPSDIYQPQNLRKITDYLTALCYSDDTILDAVIFTADGRNAFSYSNASGRNIYLNYEYTDLPYITAFADTGETITAVYDEAPPYLTLTHEGDSRVITFIAKLYDMDYPTRQIITGYLLINFSPAEIDGTYNEIEAASNGEYIIINKNNEVIYSNNPEYLNCTYETGFLNAQDINFQKSISLSGLQVISSVSDEALSKNIIGMFIPVAAVSVVSILIVIVTVTVLHRVYQLRFEQLAVAMEKISQGDFDTKLPVNSKDEIGYLSESFNTMCETLDTYIKRNYLAETQRRTAELYALQAQINPHFLANTIESIRMQAIADDNYEVAEMLAKLGNLFRWMVQFHQNIVYLEDDLDYIETYLDLQKFRFGDKIDIRIDVSPDILYLGIPKFTIQPLVENALTHGLPQNRQTLEIHIHIAVIDDVLTLSVADNGNGMEEEKLSQLKEHIWGKTALPGYGVALRNIHKRLQLLFGEQYGVSIDSEPQNGTVFVVTLPALEKKEMETYV